MKPPLSNGFLRLGIAAAAALLALLLPSVAQALPDGYVYEKVSPADKGNGEVAGGETLNTGIRAAEYGDRILYPADGAMAGATSFAQANNVFAERGAESWSARATTAIVPFTPDPATGMSAGAAYPFPQSFSRDGSKTVIDIAAHNGMATSSKPLIDSACKSINAKKASKLKAKAKKLLKKAKKADDKTKAKQLRKQARKLKRQARKLGR